MGNFYTKANLADFQDDRYGTRRKADWFVGFRENNFSCHVLWYERDDINNNPIYDIPRIEVRRWCERSLTGDILALECTDEQYMRDTADPFDHGKWLEAKYIEFHFELEEDMVAFKLHWDQCISSN